MKIRPETFCYLMGVIARPSCPFGRSRCPPWSQGCSARPPIAAGARGTSILAVGCPCWGRGLGASNLSGLGDWRWALPYLAPHPPTHPDFPPSHPRRALAACRLGLQGAYGAYLGLGLLLLRGSYFLGLGAAVVFGGFVWGGGSRPSGLQHPASNQAPSY
jgi:hypothetical protein